MVLRPFPLPEGQRFRKASPLFSFSRALTSFTSMVFSLRSGITSQATSATCQRARGGSFHYYPNLLGRVGLADSDLPKFKDTGAFLGEFGIRAAGDSQGDLWPE